MFATLGRVAFRRRWLFLTSGLLFVFVALTWGTSVFSSLSDDGFGDPRSESFPALL